MTNNELIILKDVHEKKKLAEMAKDIGKSVGSVQTILSELQRRMLIYNEYGPRGGGLAAGRKLTPSGMSVLRSNHLIK